MTKRNSPPRPGILESNWQRQVTRVPLVARLEEHLAEMVLERQRRRARCDRSCGAAARSSALPRRPSRRRGDGAHAADAVRRRVALTVQGHLAETGPVGPGDVVGVAIPHRIGASVDTRFTSTCCMGRATAGGGSSQLAGVQEAGVRPRKDGRIGARHGRLDRPRCWNGRWYAASPLYRVLVCRSSCGGQPRRASDIDWAAVENEAAAMLADYIRIDTTNPPGNETAATEFLAAKFATDGIEARLRVGTRARQSLARLPRQAAARRPIVLLNHLDVVPADAAGVEPPAVRRRDRGRLRERPRRARLQGNGRDRARWRCSSSSAAASAVARRPASSRTADEEAGGEAGAGWIVPRISGTTLGNPEYVFNEGGAIHERDDGRAHLRGRRGGEDAAAGCGSRRTASPGTARRRAPSRR